MGNSKSPAKETDPLTTSIDGAGKKSSATLWQDVKDTTRMAIPIFFAMLSFTGMRTTDSAFLGHVSDEALSAAALSDIWTSCTAVLMQARVLNAIVGPAIGGGNLKMAGIYLQISIVVQSAIAVFVFISWNFTGLIWTAFGSDEEISKMAGYYARVLSFSLPARLLFGQLSQFFSSMRILNPEVVASSTGLIANVVLGYILIFGLPFANFDGFGFEACPIVTASMVYLQLFLLWFIAVYWRRLHEPAWGGWDWKEITWERVHSYWELYYPAALGLASDFWRVAAVGAVAAKLGEEEVAVFNTGYRVMWIVLIMIGAIASASGIGITQRLGSFDVAGSIQSAEVGVKMSAVLLLIIGTLVAWQIRLFGRIFTDSEEFLDLFEEARIPFTFTLVLMNMSVALERVPYSLGQTKQVFWLGFIASWGFQVPGVILLTQFWRDDLIGLYTGMAIGYFALVILYGYLVLSSDWEGYAVLARKRSELEEKA